VTITVGSVCSGYGGLEMGLSQVMGIDLRWHAEVDPDASLVLKTHWPDVPNLGDFTVPDFWQQAERADVHVGGIPCQPFSAAGRQRGEADARHLWPYWRAGIAIQHPATVVFENVANLTRGKMRATFDAIIRDLLGLGYDVRWCLLGACAVGAAHHRHRVFLLACRTRTTPNAAQVAVQTCGQAVAAYLPTPRHGDDRNGATYRNARNDPGGLAAVKLLGLLPTPASRDGDPRGEGSPDYWERRRAERTETSGRRNGVELASALNMLPTPRHSDAKNGGPNQGVASGDIALSSAVQPERWGKYAEAIARHEAVLGRPAPEPTEIGPRGGRRLAATFSEWLMMLPAGHLTSVLGRNPALARAGNGVVPLQAATGIRLLFNALEGS
jgi:DNA (cytosine-5)-methyltransferase 1